MKSKLKKNEISVVIIVGLMLIISCSPKVKTINKVTDTEPKLELLWQSDTLLTTVESVIYDPKSQFIYTSNIEGTPAKKDGVGSISKLDINGNIIDRNWVKGLNAPKGMDIYMGKLYVTDIDRLHVISISDGNILQTYDVENAVFLNDVAIATDGTVYFSGTDRGKIFRLQNGVIDVLMNFDSPNGLFVEGDNLWVASWNKKTFNRVNMKTNKITQVADNIHNPDGIEAIGNGDYFVSSWNGMVQHITKNGIKKVLLDTREDKIFAADIDYIISKNILLVPCFFDNRVMAYKFVE